eukprot:TRINITY_DN2395_c3_g2_i2.p1 TRINITY_DN2395_c3_g2~~TRINITY_DN2395_c3_g2_i2.p1  ORF type:complete len:397 (+),score=169.24 TRINITY_DN2395_c3_g2_i2:122-1192(+)
MAQQRAAAELCAARAVATPQCVAVSQSLAALAVLEARTALLGLPGVQQRPTPQRPFVFLHLDKCGGSSIRKLVMQGALLSGLTYFGPCFDGYQYNPTPKSCLRFDLATVPEEQRAQLEVIALHPRHGWGAWRELPAVATEADVSCFFMVRHPVERVISYYYDRVATTLSEPRLNALSPAALRDVMLTTYGTSAAKLDDGTPPFFTDEGMVDAGCKLLNEAVVHTGREINEFTQEPVHALPYTLELAQSRLNRCVVGLLDRWDDTKATLAKWFPWMVYEIDIVNHRSKADKETLTSLRPELRAVVEMLNPCDMALYAHARARFEAQMQVVTLTRRYAALGIIAQPSDGRAGAPPAAA